MTEPAMIPVPRKIGGRWTTVMITREEWLLAYGSQGLAVQAYWKDASAFLRRQLEGARGEADKQPPELRIPHEAGLYRAVADASLGLIDEILAAVEASGDATPPRTNNVLVVNGKHYPVIYSWVEVESPSDGRIRWGIDTEAEVQPTEAEATAPDQEPTGASLFRQSGPAVD